MNPTTPKAGTSHTAAPMLKTPTSAAAAMPSGSSARADPRALNVSLVSAAARATSAAAATSLTPPQSE